MDELKLEFFSPASSLCVPGQCSGASSGTSDMIVAVVDREFAAYHSSPLISHNLRVCDLSQQSAAMALFNLFASRVRQFFSGLTQFSPTDDRFQFQLDEMSRRSATGDKRPTQQPYQPPANRRSARIVDVDSADSTVDPFTQFQLVVREAADNCQWNRFDEIGMSCTGFISDI